MTTGAAKQWWRVGRTLGLAVGLVIGGALEWYFNWGPGALSADRGEAHGLWLMLVGAPGSWVAMWLLELLESVPLVVVRILLILSVGASWALYGGALGWVLDEAGALSADGARAE